MIFPKLHKKTVLLALLFFLGAFVFSAAKADIIDDTDEHGPSADSLVNAYFNRCLNSVLQDLAPETREEFCACTSAQAKQQLSMSQLQMRATGKGSKIDPETLALKIMAPCLGAPIGDIEYTFCMNDTRRANMFKTQEAYNATCHCVSSGMARFVDEYGADLMAVIVKVNPENAENPTKSLRDAAHYGRERGIVHAKCLNDNARQ